MKNTHDDEAGCSCVDKKNDGSYGISRDVKRVICGSIIYAAAILAATYFKAPEMLVLCLYLVAYFVIGGLVVKEAVTNIFRGKIFDENFLMAIATVGAFFIGDYAEAVAVMLFFNVGELFQSYSVGKSRRSIAGLMDLRPDFAYVRQGNDFVRLSPEEVKKGDIIQVKAGEKIPVDGIVTAGHSFIDTKALTGESVPREILDGGKINSGCINLTGVLEIKAEKEYGESTVAKILELVENAASRKAKAEQFITKFARIYTPLVVGAALLLSIIPPLLGGGDFRIWLYRALTFLVISCPCALVISIPMGFFGGIGRASRAGILIKGSNYLEALRGVKTVVLDKTGTLTKGNFTVSKINPAGGVTAAKLLEIAAHAESFSSHPISKSLLLAYGKEIDKTRLENVEEIAGFGITALLDGRKVYVGNDKLMDFAFYSWHIAPEKGDGLTDSVGQHTTEIASNTPPAQGTVVHVVHDSQYLGHILISDEIRDDAFETVKGLKNLGIKTVMLTGDKDSHAGYFASKLMIDEYHSELLPAGKVYKVEVLLELLKPTDGKLAFIGDGINDAPVLSRADIGIAMGGLGSDAAIEAADVVFMNDKPSQIIEAINISRRTVRIVRENIVFSLSVKVLFIIMAAFGYTTMWAAVFADVGVAFLAILNALRVYKFKPR
ncbi:MAG: heavy metal translocating P-type ATPase [Lachnospiraceae bacterium]|nr:heavy metal translocating P-type ATPase [Lachnospiraceae bacterium]